MSVNRKMSMDEFADHEPSKRGGRTEHFNWKNEGDDGDGEVRLWLVDDPLVLWRHELHRVAKYEKDDKEVEKVHRLFWNSMETEEELLRKIKQQAYWLDSDRDEDKRALPKVDPVLKLLEWLRAEVRSDEINWLEPVLRWEARDDDDVELTPAQVLGILPEKKEESEVLDDDDRSRIKKLKLSLDDARKSNCKVGVKYAFVVVNHDKPDRGALLAIEPETIGNKIKQLYKHRKTRFKGDGAKATIVRQLCVQWEFYPKKSFSDMYEVVPLDDEKPSDEILALFAKYDEEPTDVSRVTEQGNVAELEANLKASWCHQVEPPWEEIFRAAYEAVKGTPAEELPGEFNHGASAKPEPKTSKAAEVLDRQQEKSAAGSDEDAVTIPCEACGKPMPETDMVCPHCKAGYAEFDGIVSLAKVVCEACGKFRPFDKSVCPHCNREYRVSADGEKVELVPLPDPPPKSEPEVKASRRRQPAKN